MLDDPIKLMAVKIEIKNMLAQIPETWDPHKKLEFLKVALRTVISEAVGKSRKIIRTDIEDLEKLVNEMHELKERACRLGNSEERDRKIQATNEAINRVKDDLNVLREKTSAETNFRARAKWFEYWLSCCCW